MNIKPAFFGLIIFLMGQLGAGIWWASSLSSEVERLAGVQGTSLPELEEAIKGSERLILISPTSTADSSTSFVTKGLYNRRVVMVITDERGH